MSWKDRVGTVIAFTSPSGLWFEASWRGNARHMEKSLGLFKYPKVVGEQAQDLDAGADRYPLNFYFEGPDHDLEAERFYQACKERGRWEVIHPTKGKKLLQLVSVTEEIQPVTSGNITEISSEWIEPIDEETVAAVSAPQLEGEVVAQIAAVQSDALDQFEDTVTVSTPSALTELKNSVNQLRSGFKAITQTVAGIRSTIEGVRNAIVSTLTGTVADVVSLGGEIQALVTLPGMMIIDLSTRFSYFEGIISTAWTLAPSRPTAGGVNRAAVHELVATSAICGMVQAVVDADVKSREEALLYLEKIRSTFDQVTAALDASQAMYDGAPIGKRYFSQSQSYNSMALLVAQVSALLLRRSFDLASAKRFTLQRERCPVEIALTEGVDLDLFISANDLRGDEILLLPSGRQVVVYL